MGQRQPETPIHHEVGIPNFSYVDNQHKADGGKQETDTLFPVGVFVKQKRA